MPNKNFCHLHLHSEYSLLDSSAKIKSIISRAKELGMESIAITDHGVMYGCVAFYKEAVAQGIKPILGCEVYVAAKSKDIKINDKDNSTHHLVLLVKNEKGYENLMEIVSTASIEGFYYKPRVDHEFLRSHSEGLIALSACLGGEVQSWILKDNYEKAKETALMYKDIFKDGFYLEIQDHGMEEQRKVTDVNIRLSQETGIPLVATNDVHYIYKEDSKAHDILMCIQTGKTTDDVNRRRYPSDQFYLKSQEEMYDMFSYVPEALENTCKIAEECNFDYEFHVSKLPKFPVPEGKTPYDYLREVCYGGLIERYDVFKEFLDKPLNVEEIVEYAKGNPEATVYVDRLEYELGVIRQMGYVDYFLITWDFIKYANDNGIPTGPGRGCFLPDTKVLLSNGSTKLIKDIIIGDEVITAYGNKSLVNNLLVYDVKEEIIALESANEIVKLTSDHEVLAIKTKPCTKQLEDRSKLPVVCKESCSLKHQCKDKAPYKEYKPEWIESKKLTENDFVLYPRTKECINDVVYDLLDYCKDEKHLRYDENYIWYEIGTNNLQTTKINRFIKLDEELCKLYGYFIAEGWTTINKDIREYKFGFGFNKKEIDYVEDVNTLCQGIFGISGYIRPHKIKESISIEFNSKVLSNFFREQCNKGANNKIIPYDAIKNCSDENLSYLIANMFRGDGSYTDINCKGSSFRIKYTTTSIELTRQIRMVLARLGYWSTFKTRTKEEEQHHDEYSVLVSGRQLLNWNNDFKNYQIPKREQKFYRNDGFYMDDDYFYIKIKSKNEEYYEGKVYDISVPGDTSYVANSMAVHNSAAGSIVAYTLGITKIDSIKYSLLFERFLNPERVSMPDYK